MVKRGTCGCRVFFAVPKLPAELDSGVQEVAKSMVCQRMMPSCGEDGRGRQRLLRLQDGAEKLLHDCEVLFIVEFTAAMRAGVDWDEAHR